jgi:hypothetical protein
MVHVTEILRYWTLSASGIKKLEHNVSESGSVSFLR